MLRVEVAEVVGHLAPGQCLVEELWRTGRRDRPPAPRAGSRGSRDCRSAGTARAGSPRRARWGRCAGRRSAGARSRGSRAAARDPPPCRRGTSATAPPRGRHRIAPPATAMVSGVGTDRIEGQVDRSLYPRGRVVHRPEVVRKRLHQHRANAPRVAVLLLVIRHRNQRRRIDGDHRCRSIAPRSERICRGTMKVGKKSVTTSAARSASCARWLR